MIESAPGTKAGIKENKTRNKPIRGKTINNSLFLNLQSNKYHSNYSSVKLSSLSIDVAKLFAISN